ncbi:exopolysaccharide Pel transporter PelG [Mesoaciditoga lauensis]|uniref:exopolysaccharide Pel transporter PelG n=1 Tax=Mesoaciditoga lauensis TaxID=1495039 RepID=UPI00056C2FC2|nr:exopolysaccharide Pel transporter PelG [Mesoaciditoga lauensis]
MAGIGFKLQRMLAKNTLTTTAMALLYSALISAGPWLIMSLNVFFIQYFSKEINIEFFKISLAYAFIFSTVIDGFFSFVINRRISDLAYANNTHQIYREYSANVFLIFSIAVAVAFFFYFFHRGYTVWQIILPSYLFVTLSVLWIQVIYASMIEKFSYLIFSFVIGNAFSLLSIAFIHVNEAWTYLLYDIGIGFIVYALHFIIFKNLKSEGFSFSVFSQMKKYWENMLVGLFYYSSIWIDDFVAWFFLGKNFYNGYRLAPSYDIPMFLSYLFIIPTMILFVINIEVGFYEQYKSFYNLLEHNGTLEEIKKKKKLMDMYLGHAILMVFAVQIVSSFVGLIISMPMVVYLNLPPESLGILRLGILGATFNAFFLFFLLITFYFDFRKVAYRATAITLSINFGLSILTTKTYPALGFTVSFLIGTSYLMVEFFKRYDSLIYVEYTRQKSTLKIGKVKVWKNEKA